MFSPYKRTAGLNLFKSIVLILNLCKSPYGSYNVHQMDDYEVLHRTAGAMSTGIIILFAAVGVC